jgi:hypothetical protein
MQFAHNPEYASLDLIRVETGFPSPSAPLIAEREGGSEASSFATIGGPDGIAASPRSSQ